MVLHFVLTESALILDTSLIRSSNEVKNITSWNLENNRL